MRGLGIALVPADTEYFYSMSEKMALELNLPFFLKKEVSIPHVSLFQGVFSEEQKVIRVFSELPLNKNLASQTVTGISIWAKKIIFLDIKNNPELQSTHEDIFHLTFPLSSGRSADPQIFEGISNKQQESFNQTGYPFSLTEYHPHMTLGHLPFEQDIQQYLTSDITKTLITFEKIIIFVVGDKGTCTEILYERMI